MRRALLVGALSVASLWLATGALAAPPWEGASAARLALSDAEAEVILGDPEAVQAKVAGARSAVEAVLAGRAADLAAASKALDEAEAAAARLDARALSAARASVWTTILRASFDRALAATRTGKVGEARSWLLVREFRPPTRFTRAAADGTLALERLAQGAVTRDAAADVVRRDLLDTYDGRIRSTLAALAEAHRLGFGASRAEAGALVVGYWSILGPAYRAQRGERAWRAATEALEALGTATRSGQGVGPALRSVESRLEGFRAAPLSPEETLRRAGQLDRFLQLVAIEYGRGVSDGRVTKDFEIQEAITFRDGAAAAFADLEPRLLARDRAATRRVKAALGGLATSLVTASRGGTPVEPSVLEATVDGAMDDLGALYPPEWKDAAKAADFDVIAAALDRMEAAAASGDWGVAESARIEAYGIFELGPEQRLRGLAPSLFQGVESLFWYGTGEQDGLVRLIKAKASSAELAGTRAALDAELAEAELRIGSGPGSRVSIVTNSAMIVFREGLEAVLILAALMASMVGAQRRYRRPLLGGVVLALGASVVTWIVAQTVLGSLARYGERLEAIVSLVAIGVLLLILNWFYHRVYWQEHLSELHGKKKNILRGAGLSLAAAQVIGLVALGFTSVYREGFETVLFLQALTLEAGPWTVLQGVAVGFAAVVAVFFLVIALERKLPHKKMLIATGLMITWVLVVLVGQTVQTLQKVGWVPVTPIEGLELPYWVGLWLGVYPTWEGILAQAAALAFVLGSYFAAETMRSRRRARILQAPMGAQRVDA
ncbi:MAG TPA: FTR1 family protein [Gaiella sp.]|nr:FTR1 family protein [Gaiella sp.]